MKNKYKIDVENKLNKYEKNRYGTLNYALAELRNIIFTYREYRDKAIEIKYDFKKSIEREMEILTMEKEREKRKIIMLRLKRKHLYDNLKFEHKVIESALHNNVITYFISQKIENKKKHYESNISILGNDGKEIKADIYNIVEKMTPERKLIYEMEVEKLRNIISTERIKCVYRIQKDNASKSFEYVTVSLPSETEEKQASYKILNNTKTESNLKKSTQIFVDSIESYCGFGSGYQLCSIMGMYCNINKYAPLRGGSYIDLPQYFKDKRCIINVQNKDNRCFYILLNVHLIMKKYKDIIICHHIIIMVLMKKKNYS